MGNVEQHREAHEAFNRGDIDAAVASFADDGTVTDCARGVTMKGREEFADWLRTWTAGFSDARIDDRRYIDAGDTTICQFVARGTHDGQFGPLPATNRRIETPFCEVVRWGSDGRGMSGELYYDQTTIMVQLGVMEAPPSA